LLDKAFVIQKNKRSENIINLPMRGPGIDLNITMRLGHTVG